MKHWRASAQENATIVSDTSLVALTAASSNTARALVRRRSKPASQAGVDSRTVRSNASATSGPRHGAISRAVRRRGQTRIASLIPSEIAGLTLTSAMAAAASSTGRAQVSVTARVSKLRNAGPPGYEVAARTQWTNSRRALG